MRAADGAAPVILAARTLDRGGIGGRLDTLSLTWSEPIAHSPDSDGAYPFGVTGYSIASAIGDHAAPLLDLALNEGSAPDSGARPPVGYTRGAGAPVRDAAGNEAASHVFAGAADAIAPRLLGARTLDLDSDGKLDRVRFEFTEPITSPQRSCSSGCGFSVTSLAAGTAFAASGTNVEVSVAEGALNGGLKPTSSYSPATGGAVRDASGNAAPASGLTAADGAPPVALDAYTADSDSDARIDQVRVTFSESLNYPGDGVGQTSFTASGYSILSASAASGATLTLNLDPKDDPDTGSAPAVGYNGQGGVRLFDANGVEHANRSWPSLTRDAVAPQFVDARTADLNADTGNEPGKVDAVELVYSEEITGTPDVNDFQVDGSAPASIDFEPDSVKLRIAEGSAYDTDVTLPISYTPGDLTDVAEGPGDTADAAPAAGGTAVDGAKPVIVEAETADTQGSPNGTVDHVGLKFSEPVTYSPGLPAFSLTSPDMPVTGVAVDGPTDLTLAVTEAGTPDGGAKPLVTVTDPARVTDAVGNTTPADPFGGTTDNVAPMLLSARLGEAAGGRCGTGVVNSRVDCVRGTWSEAVVQPAAFSSLSLSTFTITGMLDAEAGQHRRRRLLHRGLDRQPRCQERSDLHRRRSGRGIRHRGARELHAPDRDGGRGVQGHQGRAERRAERGQSPAHRRDDDREAVLLGLRLVPRVAQRRAAQHPRRPEHGALADGEPARGRRRPDRRGASHHAGQHPRPLGLGPGRLDLLPARARERAAGGRVLRRSPAPAGGHGVRRRGRHTPVAN